MNSNDIQYLDKKNEIDKILFAPNTDIAKEIKYYTLKLCRKFYEKSQDYEDFIKYFYEKINIYQKEEYFKDIKLNDNKIFFYSMIPLRNSYKSFLIFFKDNEKLE